MLHIKKGDTVIIRSGEEKGKSGKVLEVHPKESKAIVEGMNFAFHHKKPRKAQEAGGITKSEAPIHLSKLQVVCPECGASTRVGFTVIDNKKVRTCKKCEKVIDKEAKKEKVKTKTKKAKTTDTDEVNDKVVNQPAAAKQATVETSEPKKAKTVKKTATDKEDKA